MRLVEIGRRSGVGDGRATAQTLFPGRLHQTADLVEPFADGSFARCADQRNVVGRPMLADYQRISACARHIHLFQTNSRKQIVSRTAFVFAARFYYRSPQKSFIVRSLYTCLSNFDNILYLVGL